jgi:pyrimidine operon attenuation protein/uracil phosphoribosyltransferase
MAEVTTNWIADPDDVAVMVGTIADTVAKEFSPVRLGDIALLGIQLNGVPFAMRLATEIERKTGHRPPVGTLDISMYRDDIGRRRKLTHLNPTEIPFDLEDRVILLVDDVLHTGRTIRAALDAITDYGRPRLIRLAVLIDRGGHEFPIRADYIGRTLAPPPGGLVRVEWQEIHGRDAVAIVTAPPATRRRRT